MRRYFFHLRAGDKLIPDMEGAGLDDSPACARHLMHMLNKAGSVDFRGWAFEITDESGEFVETLLVEEVIGAVH